MNNNKSEPTIKITSYYLEDTIGIEQPKKEDIQRLCEQLNLPFNKQTVVALIYGDNTILPERILPYWLNELAGDEKV